MSRTFFARGSGIRTHIVGGNSPVGNTVYHGFQPMEDGSQTVTSELAPIRKLSPDFIDGRREGRSCREPPSGRFILRTRHLPVDEGGGYRGMRGKCYTPLPC